MEYQDIFERPNDSELLPVCVLWKSGGGYRDYISAGLVNGRDLVEYQRGLKPPTWKMLVWEPVTIIRYNKESGGLRGLVGSGPVDGGHGVLFSKECPAAFGEPLETCLMTQAVWKKIVAWGNVGNGASECE